ncbi:MAG: calcium-binding protein [Microcoleaceae cyanobacterium]
MSTIIILNPDVPFFQADNTASDDGGQIISADFRGRSDDAFLGSEGSDLIFTLNGNDSVLGGGGDDQVTAGNGNDAVAGGEGNDAIALGNGNDLGIGGLGDDVLDGGNGADRLYGGFGNDIVIGGTGDDTLKGGFGDDTLDGGKGADSFIFGPDSGVDTIIGFTPGQDQIVFEGIDADAVDVTYDAASGSLSIDGEEIAILDAGLDVDEDDFTFM